MLKKKNAADSKTKETNLDTHTTCLLIAVREGLLDFYSDQAILSSTCSGIGGYACYLSSGVGTLSIL